MSASSLSLVPSSSAAPASSVLLDHERLDVYRIAVELDEAVASICRTAGRGHGWLRDQALRASGSVVLNFAEAMGREGADRAKHVRYARGSALETDAALTLFAHRGACSRESRGRVRELTVRVVAMLTRLGRVGPRR